MLRNIVLYKILIIMQQQQYQMIHLSKGLEALYQVKTKMINYIPQRKTVRIMQILDLVYLLYFG
ncbi:hypothetical protein SDC9_162363 [bioreactor metagenome]|uniref:Uncharacterized protein n=1 Tax=bioreactor metagenome TaxID=1076179 RepID=A0A645FS67_9ZZZZ